MLREILIMKRLDLNCSDLLSLSHALIVLAVDKEGLNRVGLYL
jgi:hypothetical protein